MRGTAVVTGVRDEIQGINWKIAKEKLKTYNNIVLFQPCFYLQDEEAEKVEVCQSLELLEEIQRQKRDERVFRGLDLVVLKARGNQQGFGKLLR